MSRFAPVFLFTLAAASLLACNENDPTGTDLTTSSEGAQAEVPVSAEDSAQPALSTASLLGTIALPINQSKATSGVLFGLTQTGTGPGGFFKINNTSSFKDAILGQSNGNGGAAVRGIHTGLSGVGGLFEVTNPSSFNTALVARSATKGEAASFSITNPNSNAAALRVETVGAGHAIFARAKSFPAANLENNSVGPTLISSNSGTGFAGEFLGKGSVATLQVANSGTGFAGRFIGIGSARGVVIETQGGAGLQVVGGSKNAVVRTPAGAKALYTEESTEVWFTDYGFGKLTNGKGRILFDPSFAQTINTDESYHVFVQPYGRAELYVAERTPLGFTVALKDGDPNAEFSYRIVAKRLGFEGKRLEAAPWVDQLPTR